MAPFLFDFASTYFVMWGCAFTFALLVGTALAVRSGHPTLQSAAALALLAALILTGSKLLYLAEAYIYPQEDYVPLGFRGAQHGFRIPGGILALAAGVPLVCRSLRLPWRPFGDAVIGMAAVALVFIRFGCFLNGCCFGRLSSLPWAMRFPRGSWVSWYHRTHGWIGADAAASLPVHPLQLYFLLAAMGTFLLVEQQRRRCRPAGQLQLLFYALFFGSTALLEPFRQNRLTLNLTLTVAASLVAVAMLAVMTVHGRETGNLPTRSRYTSRAARP